MVRKIMKKMMFSFSMMLILSNCGIKMKSETSSTNSDGSLKVFSTVDVNKYPLNKLVCDPFDGPPAQDFTQGLKAKLWYLKPGDPRNESVAGIINNGVASTQDLFFSQINVPTRLFTAGFPTQTGALIKTDSGADLLEYFALRFEGGLRLADDDEEGTYELALLSDDGANLYLGQPEGGMTKMVSNDGLHPTRFGCGSTVDMTRTSQYDFKLEYYQGPRYHISVIPMWRKVNGSRIPEPLCGATGNSTFFDFNNNSTPQKAYNDLLARGWRPIRAENYRIPKVADYNPCVNGQTPVISNFHLDAVEGMIATWTTDIPATSQLRYVDKTTGVEMMTVSDNVLRTTHRVTMFDVVFGHTYEVQAVSISDTLGKGFGPLNTVTF